MAIKNKKELLSEQREALLNTLKNRFEQNSNCHKGIEWKTVQARLEANPAKLWSLNEMKRSGGEPDLVVLTINGENKIPDEYIFYDCSAESPKGRKSICYDRAALESRKEFKPANITIDLAAAMGVEIITEAQYRALQQLENFDKKTSSWIQTPRDIRKPGVTLFCDKRYNTVFVYHNGAESYYAVRGFRGW